MRRLRVVLWGVAVLLAGVVGVGYALCAGCGRGLGPDGSRRDELRPGVDATGFVVGATYRLRKQALVVDGYGPEIRPMDGASQTPRSREEFERDRRKFRDVHRVVDEGSTFVVRRVRRVVTWNYSYIVAEGELRERRLPTVVHELIQCRESDREKILAGE